MRAYPYAIATGKPRESAGDGVRILNLWEDAVILLCREGYAVVFKPPEGIVMVEHVEQPFHEPVSAWIDLLQVCHPGK